MSKSNSKPPGATSGGKRPSEADSSELSDIPRTSAEMQAVLESQRLQSEAQRRADASADRVLALSDANNKLKEEVVSLRVTNAALQKENTELKAQKSAHPGGKLPQLAPQEAAGGEVTAHANKTHHISNEDRMAIIRLVNMFRQQFPEASQKSIICNLVCHIKPRWSAICDATVARWRKEAEQGVVRFPSRNPVPVKEGNEDPTPQQQEMRDIVEMLNQWGGVYTIRGAHSWIVELWKTDPPTEPPSLSTFYRYLETFYRTTTARLNRPLGPNQEDRIQIWRLEIGYLICKHNVPLELVYNLDESAIRMITDHHHQWVLKKVLPGLQRNPNEPESVKKLCLGDMEKLFPNHRKYTTTTAVCTAAGEFLTITINWKGTYRLQVKEYMNSTRIRQFCQPKTHWTTMSSFMDVVTNVIQPHYNKKIREMGLTGHPPPFILVVDCAPIHISEKVRTEFSQKVGASGILHFLPPGLTSCTQPLDISVFAPFKATMRAVHHHLLNQTLIDADLSIAVKFAATTKQTRGLLLKALDTACAGVKASTIKRGWFMSIGGPKQPQQPKTKNEPQLSDSTFMPKLKDLHAQSITRIDHEKTTKAAYKKEVEAAKAKKAKLPTDTVSYCTMFRFGVPGGIEQCEEEHLMSDAYRYQEDDVHRPMQFGLNDQVIRDKYDDDGRFLGNGEYSEGLPFEAEKSESEEDVYDDDEELLPCLKPDSVVTLDGNNNDNAK